MMKKGDWTIKRGSINESKVISGTISLRRVKNQHTCSLTGQSTAQSLSCPLSGVTTPETGTLTREENSGLVLHYLATWFSNFMGQTENRTWGYNSNLTPTFSVLFFFFFSFIHLIKTIDISSTKKKCWLCFRKCVKCWLWLRLTAGCFSVSSLAVFLSHRFSAGQNMKKNSIFSVM